MKTFATSILCIFLLLLVSSGNASAYDLQGKVIQFRLTNGMRWLLVKRTQAPVFAGIVEVKTGGMDEVKGRTGLAHMLEHMLFKGTRDIGTTNFEDEKKYLNEIARLGKEYQDEQGKERPDKEKLSKLEKEMASNLEAERKYIIPNELWEVFQRNGANDLNAYTSKDVTTFHAEMPANRLELWAYLISSMLFEGIPREFYAEKKVVMEERRDSVDDNPYGKAFEGFLKTFFKGTPYEWPTIGTEEDVKRLSVGDVMDFYRDYYSPSDMVGALVGDINIAEAKSIISRYFGRIKTRKPPQRYADGELMGRGEERLDVKFPAKPFVEIAFHKPTMPSEDDYVFDVIYYLMCEGKTSRLYKRLITKDEIASYLSCGTSVPGVRLNNAFMIMVRPLGEHQLEKIEREVFEELDKLKNETISDEELKKVRNQVNASFLWGLKENLGLANEMVFFELITDDWRYIVNHSKKINSIGSDDIARVAKKYFTPENRIIVTFKK